MRKDGIPYVANPKSYYPPVDYKKMNLQELKKKYIDTCGKSQGLLSNCSKCTTPCEYGKRATQLLAGEVYDGVPLYGGKTLIERAKEENMKKKEVTMKGNRMFIDNWYDKASQSEDPVKWVMEAYGIDQRKAKQKIMCWKYRHMDKEVIKEETKESNSFEMKIDSLMKLQEKHKKLMAEFQEQYEKAKHEYDEISKKIDVLCRAMDIMNE